MPTRKLTTDEIKARQDAAQGYWQVAQDLTHEMMQAANGIKVLRAQRAEAIRNMDTCMAEIQAGEIEVDPQMNLKEA